MEALNELAAGEQAELLERLGARIIACGPSGVDGLVTLLRDPDPVVCGMAAVFLMPIRTDLAVGTLTTISHEAGLLGFRARAALDRWESGEWRSNQDNRM